LRRSPSICSASTQHLSSAAAAPRFSISDNAGSLAGHQRRNRGAVDCTVKLQIKLAVRFCVIRGAHHCAAMVDKRLNEGSIEHVESRQHSASKCAGRGLRVWVQHHYGARPAARLFCLRDAGRSRSSRSTCSVGYQRSR
jgi:hypothetical protein